MSLPSVDVGLMANHLQKHEAIIHKLVLYRSITPNTAYEKIVTEQIDVMHNHVKAMLQLLVPDHHGTVNIPPIHSPQLPLHQYHVVNHDYKEILIETNSTSQFMAMENFISAMQMKNHVVSHVHITMALQQAHFVERYSHLIMKHGWEQPPMASPEQQLKVIQQFSHLLQ